MSFGCAEKDEFRRTNNESSRIRRNMAAGNEAFANHLARICFSAPAFPLAQWTNPPTLRALFQP
jgi:hypothetical protein